MSAGFTVVVHAGAGVMSGAFSLIETVEAIADQVNDLDRLGWGRMI